MQLAACAPGFEDDPNVDDGGEDCFSVRTHKEAWITAQEYCRYTQANLADLDNSAQADLITGNRATPVLHVTVSKESSSTW